MTDVTAKTEPQTLYFTSDLYGRAAVAGLATPNADIENCNQLPIEGAIDLYNTLSPDQNSEWTSMQTTHMCAIGTYYCYTPELNFFWKN